MATATSESEAAQLPPLVLLVDYRALVETVDLDNVNMDAWREALDAFGYQDLDEPTFLQDLALSTSAEVMMALCPYTTKDEWGPALNRRDLRLAREVSEMCYANLVPIPGVTDLITNASKLRRTTVVVLSPFRDDITKTMLETANLQHLVDVVVCYTSLDAAVLEALAALHCPPPLVPERFAATMPDAFKHPDAAMHGADIVAFVSTRSAAKKMRGYGVSLVGMLHNSCDQEIDHEEDSADDGEDPDVLPGRDDAASMQQAGCVLNVLNYKFVTPGHLALLRSANAAVRDAAAAVAES